MCIPGLYQLYIRLAEPVNIQVGRLGTFRFPASRYVYTGSAINGLDQRSAFSGIVAGNVKSYGIDQIRQHGPYRLNGDKRVMQAMDNLLQDFVRQGRMKLKGKYTPCYKVVSGD